MKLWHDDIRPAPEGWEWARTNERAIEFLENQHHHGYQITHLSMDHDLGLHEVDPYQRPEAILLAGPSSNGCGCDLARWIAEHPESLKWVEFVRVHSWNPDGAKEMAAILNDAGIDVYLMPFSTNWYSGPIPRQFGSLA